MTDPRRLLQAEATPFERQLLDAAANERPPAELVSSMQQALGASAIAAKTGAGAAGMSSIAYAALAALAAGGALVALVLLREPAPAPLADPAARAVRAPLAPAPAPPAEVAPSPVVELPNEPPRPIAERPAQAARKAARVSSESELRDEIRLLDQARAALRAGATDKTLSLLARYTERYPGGAFRQEATVLQLEALERAGQRGKASALARKFLEEHPESPHVERVGRTAASD